MTKYKADFYNWVKTGKEQKYKVVGSVTFFRDEFCDIDLLAMAFLRAPLSLQNAIWCDVHRIIK